MIMNLIQWALANWMNMAIAIGSLLLAVAAVLDLIPGDQKESKIRGFAAKLLGLKKP